MPGWLVFVATAFLVLIPLVLLFALRFRCEHCHHWSMSATGRTDRFAAGRAEMKCKQCGHVSWKFE